MSQHAFAPVFARRVHDSKTSASDAWKALMELMSQHRMTTLHMKQTGVVQIMRSGEVRFIDYLEFGKLLPENKPLPPQHEIEMWFEHQGLRVEVKDGIIPAPPRPAYHKARSRPWGK